MKIVLDLTEYELQVVQAALNKGIDSMKASLSPFSFEDEQKRLDEIKEKMESSFSSWEEEK